MQISTIFAVKQIAPDLYSIQFEKGVPHAFEQVFDNWNDIEYLFDFFDEHISDLQSDFWQEQFQRLLTIDEAIEITTNEVGKFEEKILDLAKQNNTSHTNFLDGLFKSLSKNESFKKPMLNIAYKAYGPESKSWLRVYAIKIGKIYVITGGAIKLTDKMEIRQHTKNELDKLQNVANELKRKHFTDTSDFDSGYIEL